MRAVTYSASTIAIYLGISLLGWGFDDLTGFFILYPRVGYAVVVTCFGLAIGFQSLAAPEGISGSKGEPGKLIKRQTIVGFSITLLMFVAMGLLPWADRREITVWSDNTFVRWLGLLLTSAGYMLIFWSGLALGRMYSADVTIQKDHQLVTHGLYRYIRHPRYLGMLLGGLGMACLYRSWLGIGLCVPLVMIIWIRIHDEEILMRQEFGPDWLSYSERSWRLIPFIY